VVKRPISKVSPARAVPLSINHNHVEVICYWNLVPESPLILRMGLGRPEPFDFEGFMPTLEPSRLERIARNLLDTTFGQPRAESAPKSGGFVSNKKKYCDFSPVASIKSAP
jgi:hypothetical protein